MRVFLFPFFVSISHHANFSSMLFLSSSCFLYRFLCAASKVFMLFFVTPIVVDGLWKILDSKHIGLRHLVSAIAVQSSTADISVCFQKRLLMFVQRISIFKRRVYCRYSRLVAFWLIFLHRRNSAQSISDNSRGRLVIDSGSLREFQLFVTIPKS